MFPRYVALMFISRNIFKQNECVDVSCCDLWDSVEYICEMGNFC